MRSFCALLLSLCVDWHEKPRNDELRVASTYASYQFYLLAKPCDNGTKQLVTISNEHSNGTLAIHDLKCFICCFAKWIEQCLIYCSTVQCTSPIYFKRIYIIEYVLVKLYIIYNYLYCVIIIFIIYCIHGFIIRTLFIIRTVFIIRTLFITIMSIWRIWYVLTSSCSNLMWRVQYYNIDKLSLQLKPIINDSDTFGYVIVMILIHSAMLYFISYIFISYIC